MKLTEYQFRVLDEAANDGSIVFAVAEGRITDEPFELVRFAKQVTELEELINEGFIQEITNTLKHEFVRKTKVDGRQCRVYALTPLGLIMFQRRVGSEQ